MLSAFSPIFFIDTLSCREMLSHFSTSAFFFFFDCEKRFVGGDWRCKDTKAFIYFSRDMIDAFTICMVAQMFWKMDDDPWDN